MTNGKNWQLYKTFLKSSSIAQRGILQFNKSKVTVLNFTAPETVKWNFLPWSGKRGRSPNKIVFSIHHKVDKQSSGSEVHYSCKYRENIVFYFTVGKCETT